MAGTSSVFVGACWHNDPAGVSGHPCLHRGGGRGTRTRRLVSYPDSSSVSGNVRQSINPVGIVRRADLISTANPMERTRVSERLSLLKWSSGLEVILNRKPSSAATTSEQTE